MKPIRILVVDNENLVREGTVAILSFQKDFKVVAEAEDGIKAVELARQHKPDVVLLDMNMPRQNGLETIPLLREVSPDSKILILSSFSESEKVYKSIKAGALGYMVKGGSRDQLVQAIRDVAAGQASLHPSIAMLVINEIEKPATMMYTTDPLTPRELDTLKLIARGHSNQEIAEILVVHERTVAKYVSSILAKLQLANRTQAALYALREGIAEPKAGKPAKLGKK